ncbi:MULTISPECIES: hypothetical protein [unclassified Polynucleobacter]|uniref:hypothetical protein n=1 Tax=unclassified Polynucleobacter TaxID=2640945 RepID=UPI0008D52918|nr:MULTISPECIES: hypothetical protein [unclassified Polynucleobacter]OHC10582.1 MAG: hypothetical protein A2X74_01720 [Polynucleobacter sp. GWA2_45_21]HBK44433.1 hypothetical protein [Polynucleobacter sp.]
MKNSLFKAFFGIFALLASSSFALAQEVSPIPKASNEWRFEITPYLWASGIKGTLGLDSGLAKSADFTSNDVVSNLKSGGMISAEAHKGQWGVMGDVVSATLQKTGAIPNTGDTVGDKITLQQTILTGVATYTVANTKDAYVDAMLGARAIYATATLNVNGYGTASKTTSTVDPIVGAKGRYRIADTSWYIPAYADIGSGGGTTNLTWQVMAGVGKSFGSLVDASLTYRALYYDMKAGGVLQKTTMQGPQVAVTFKF